MANKKLFIIHGWAYSLDSWSETVRELRASGLNVVQLKVPGLTRDSSEVWNIDRYVEWLKTELKNEKSPIILGHSNGGRIALNFDVKYPGVISKLILLNSAGLYDSSTKTSLRRKLLRDAAKAFKFLRAVPLLRKLVYRLLGAGDYNRAPSNMKKTLQNVINSDKELDLSRVSAKTEMLWGSEDRETPIADGRRIHKLVKGSNLKEFPGWDHNPHRHHPEQLAKEIIKLMEAS